MRKTFGAVLILLLFPFILYAAEPEVYVEIYSAASAAAGGRSAGRTDTISVSLDRFNNTKSVEASAGGITTAVQINARVKNALEKLLEDKDYFIVEDSILSRQKINGEEVFNFVWDRFGFEVSCAFEKLPGVVRSVIEKVYGDDAWLYGELIKSYYDNYAVKIYKAEDVISPAAGKLDFLDAMISATVIGDSFQPLLGIHDGLGVLDDIGLVVARAEAAEEGGLSEFRELESDDEKIEAFVHSVSNMEGDFVENLYSSIREITRKLPDDGRIIPPGDFFSSRRGDNADFCMFFYEVLRRNSYQVKYIVIDSGTDELYSTVFFREKNADLWGRIDGNGLERERSENWRRLPALVFSASVNYFEPDVHDILKTGTIYLPPPSRWKVSLY